MKCGMQCMLTAVAVMHRQTPWVESGSGVVEGRQEGVVYSLSNSAVQQVLECELEARALQTLFCREKEAGSCCIVFWLTFSCGNLAACTLTKAMHVSRQAVVC